MSPELARVVLWSTLRNDGHHLTCNLCCPVGRLQWWRVIESTAETVRLSISAIIRRRRALSRHTHTNPADVNIIGSILPHPRTTSPTAPAAEARLRLLLYTEMGEAGNLIRLHFIWFITYSRDDYIYAAVHWHGRRFFEGNSLQTKSTWQGGTVSTGKECHAQELLLVDHTVSVTKHTECVRVQAQVDKWQQIEQVGVRPDSCCDMRPPRIITDEYNKNEAFSAGEMYLTTCVEWAGDQGLSLTQIDLLLTKICAKNDFYIFVHSNLDLWPSDLKFARLITNDQHYVSTKREVSKALQFRENRGHGRTDRRRDRRRDGRGATLNAVRLIILVPDIRTSLADMI